MDGDLHGKVGQNLAPLALPGLHGDGVEALDIASLNTGFSGLGMSAGATSGPPGLGGLGLDYTVSGSGAALTESSASEGAAALGGLGALTQSSSSRRGQASNGDGGWSPLG